MKVFNFLICSLIIIACQPKESIPENKERVKYFKSEAGYVIADYSKKEFIIAQKTGNNYDTIFRDFATSIIDIPEVKIFDSKCIFLVNNGLIIYFIAYKKVGQTWEPVGSRQLLMINLPAPREIKIVNENNIQVWTYDKLILEYFIGYEKNEFKLIDYYKK